MKKNINTIIVDVINQQLREKNITAYKMSKDLQINEGNLSGVLNKKRNVSLKILNKIFNYLELKDIKFYFKEDNC